MEYIQILEMLGTAIAASWLTRILTIRARVRQENAAAKKGETEVKADQIENIEKMLSKAYTPIINGLTEQINNLQAKVDRLEKEKDQQDIRIEELETQNAAYRKIILELRPDFIQELPSRRGANGKTAPRDGKGHFIKREEA